ncbi:MAG: tripartite tricarboxylate transporter permease [Alkalilacustris sp.]
MSRGHVTGPAMLETLISALFILLDPFRMGMLLAGVSIGIMVGILPGLGGLMGMALVLPFLFGMDPYAGIAMLVGISAAVPSSDTFPSVLMGIPGSSGSQATVMDGYPMARNGEAARALGAAFSASLIGGLIGAVALTALVPFARPLVLAFGAPELLMLTILGLCMVGVLSGSRPLLGIIAACVGLILGMVGGAPAAPEYRWAFGNVYLFDGFSLVIVALGLFAIPEIVDLMARGGSIARRGSPLGGGWVEGFRDTLRHKYLVVRHSLIGVLVGAIPGMGSSIIDWLNYGIVVTRARDRSRFGKGDVRGVIAPEAANNAREGGVLMPTLLFGVPGSSAMALFLGALLIFGVQPGPALLRDNLELVFVIIWSLALGNVFGTIICLVLSKPISRLTFVPFQYIAPVVLCIVVLGAWQETRHVGDLMTLAAFGLLGWTMKRIEMPRPPLLVGFILAGLVERYLWMSYSIYDWEWLTRPIVLAIAVLCVVLMFGGTVMKSRTLRATADPAERRDG